MLALPPCETPGRNMFQPDRAGDLARLALAIRWAFVGLHLEEVLSLAGGEQPPRGVGWIAKHERSAVGSQRSPCVQ